MCLFYLIASVALLLYPAKRETMFLRRLRYIPHMFLFRPHMFLFRMVAFESLFVSVAVGSLLSFLHTPVYFEAGHLSCCVHPNSNRNGINNARDHDPIVICGNRNRNWILSVSVYSSMTKNNEVS